MLGHERADAPRPFEATWRARKSTTSATGIAVSAALCARPGRALLSAGRPKHTDQGRTNRHARASPLPQLHMRKGVNRNPSRRPELADSDSNLHAVKMTQNWALLTPPLSRAAGTHTHLVTKTWLPDALLRGCPSPRARSARGAGCPTPSCDRYDSSKT